MLSAYGWVKGHSAKDSTYLKAVVVLRVRRERDSRSQKRETGGNKETAFVSIVNLIRN
jgi:hypothetical protein